MYVYRCRRRNCYLFNLNEISALNVVNFMLLYDIDSCRCLSLQSINSVCVNRALAPVTSPESGVGTD